jgi:DDE family transposase
MLWTLPAPFTPAEDKLCNRLKKAGRFYMFLRTIRDRLFDDTTQQQLIDMYTDGHHGTPPKVPALVAMVLLLQAYAKVSDEEAIRRVFMDKAWLLVLGWLEAPEAEIQLSQGTLFNFRQRLIGAGLDTMLLARTVALARETGLFGSRALAGLRLVIDSAPLEGAGRVEDTLNLLGHALRHVTAAVAALLECGVAEVARSAGVTVLCGPSIKAALDLDWTAPDAVRAGLQTLLVQRAALDAWLAQQSEAVRWHTTVRDAQAVVARIVEQDTEGDPKRGGRQIKDGVAVDRLISLHDPEMRHGRKSATQRIDGYKRYIGSDLDAAIVLGVAVQAANVGEHHGADALRPEVEQHGEIAEVHIDRAFLASQLVVDLDARGDPVVAKPYPAQGKPGFTKPDFTIDLDVQQVTCPAGTTVPIRGTQATFPTPVCAACSKRPQCQRQDAKKGRTLQIHPQEALMKKLRAEVKTPEGRAARRERVEVEHELAHLVALQGDRARYFGARKNEYDLRRAGVVFNLHAIQRQIGIAYEIEEAA